MRRMFIPVLVAAIGAASAAYAAAPPAYAGSADPFTVSGIKVDATARTPREASNLAMAQGRPLAWSELFRRFTVQSEWERQPRLTDNQLLGLILGVEAVNERRNTTRYLADVNFRFNPEMVQRLLRTSNIASIEVRTESALVIPLTAGGPGFDPQSPWAIAWTDTSLQQRLVPFVVPKGGTPGLAVLMRSDLVGLDWAALAPLADRHNAGRVILAVANEDATAVQVIEISPAGRTVSSLALVRSNFAAGADAIAEKSTTEWQMAIDLQKATNAPQPIADDGARTRLTVNVHFNSLEAWVGLRTRLAAVNAITMMEVAGLTSREARIELTYFGQMEQLRDAFSRQNLELSGGGGQYTLDLGIVTAANLP